MAKEVPIEGISIRKVADELVVSVEVRDIDYVIFRERIAGQWEGELSHNVSALGIIGVVKGEHKAHGVD